MLALIFLVLSFLSGIQILRRTTLRLNGFELTLSGFLLGSMLGTWTVYLLSLLFNQDVGMVLTILILAVVSGWLSTEKQSAVVKISFSLKQAVTYTVFTLFWIAVLLPLFLSHMMEAKPDGLYSGGGAWGDLALHSTFIHKFAGNSEIDLTSPIYAGEKTTYPILFDYYTSLLMRFGFSLQAALVFTGFSFSLVFLHLTYFFILRLTKSHGAAFGFTVLFFFNGGIGAWYAYQDWMTSGSSLPHFLLNMKVEYAHLADFGLRFSNLIADYVLPQRAILVGLPAFTLILIILRSLWLSKDRHHDRKILLCVILGLLPLFHIHTFLATLGLVLCFILGDVMIRGQKLTSWILPLLLLTLLAAPQLWWQFGHTSAQGFVRLQFGWMKGQENLLIFWLRNLGLEALFLTIGGFIFLAFVKKQQFAKLIFVPLVILFIITNLIVFQPHDYDNMKLMIYSHFAIVMVSTILLHKLYEFKLIGKLLTLMFFVGLTLTGGLSILRETYTSWKIANTSDLEIAGVIKQKTEPQAIFLSADNHNHPVTMLAGRSIVMGYRGWLWTHGIDYSQTEQEVGMMLRGEPGAEVLFSKHRISYVYIGASEVDNFRADLTYFMSRYPVLFRNTSGAIFDVRSSKIPNVAQTKL